MSTIILTLFFFSLGMLIYGWGGYPLALWIISKFSNRIRLPYNTETFTPNVSIILSAYNEEGVIVDRLNNLCGIDYPNDKIEIIVASDGSDDQTVDLCRGCALPGCNILDFKLNRGKATVHNDCIQQASGDIVVITDADTMFEKDFLRNIVQPFQDPKVGCTTGNLKYLVRREGVANSESIYWRYETFLRRLESCIGLLSNASGACMAFRRSLFKPLTSVDDTDTATVVDIILAGYRVELVESAVAYDIPPHTAGTAFRVKVRGTSKTLVSYTRRGDMALWFRRPGLVWTIFSHRLLRYLTPYTMLVLFATNYALIDTGILFRTFLLLQWGGYFLFFVGAAAELCRKRIPLASSIFAFGIALCGMAVGVWVALFGKPPATHKTDDSL